MGNQGGRDKRHGDDDDDDDDGVKKVHALTWSGETAKVTLEPISYLGKGAFGTVKKMLLDNEQTGERGYVAVKDPVGPERLNTMEKSILLVIRHENICNLLYYYMDKVRRMCFFNVIQGENLFFRFRWIALI